MNTDPDYWEEPLKFDPALHFLDENGEIKKCASYAPFGFGKRICLGEQLAKYNMFILATRLLQKVRLEKVAGENYSLEYEDADMVFVPLPYSVRVVPRK